MSAGFYVSLSQLCRVFTPTYWHLISPKSLGNLSHRVWQRRFCVSFVGDIVHVYYSSHVQFVCTIKEQSPWKYLWKRCKEVALWHWGSDCSWDVRLDFHTNHILWFLLEIKWLKVCLIPQSSCWLSPNLYFMAFSWIISKIRAAHSCLTVSIV